MGGQGCREDRTIRGVSFGGGGGGALAWWCNMCQERMGDVKQNCPSLRHAHQTKLHLGKTLVGNTEKITKMADVQTNVDGLFHPMKIASFPSKWLPSWKFRMNFNFFRSSFFWFFFFSSPIAIKTILGRRNIAILWLLKCVSKVFFSSLFYLATFGHCLL